MRACVAGVCECLAGSEERLNELGRGSGDGDWHHSQGRLHW